MSTGHEDSRPPSDAEPALTAAQRNLLPLLLEGAVVFYDGGFVFCGRARLSGVSLGDLAALVERGILARIGEQAFELTARGRELGERLAVRSS